MTGTWSLIRLALRRDRVVLAIWIVVLGMAPLSGTSGYETFYPSAAERASLTATIGRNPSVAVLYGPAFDLSTPGGFTAWRFGGVLALGVGLMAVFTVTRHTRADEETGRTELLASAVVGRRAFLTAAIAVAAGASAVIGILEALVLLGAGQPAAGSWAMGLSTAAAGVVATSIAAVACQIAAFARTANGIGAAALGVAFLLRAVGDSSSGARWASWLSPIGWTQQVRPFAGERWWVLALPALIACGLGSLAYALVSRRDLGRGMIDSRPGPATGSRRLSSLVALGWRLQRPAAAGWFLGMVVGGAVFGSIADGIGDLVGDSEQSRHIFERLGGTSGLVDAFLASVAGIYAMVIAFYGVQALLRMRSEEVEQRLEPLLATPVRRVPWAASHLVFAFGVSAAALVAAGAATGVTHGLRAGDVGGAVADMVAATAVQIPAMWVVLGVGVALFGLAPRWSTIAWAVAGLFLAISLFGPVVDAPPAVLDLSPFGHVPKLPGASIDAAPLLVLGAIVATTVGAGLVGLRRRDIG